MAGAAEDVPGVSSVQLDSDVGSCRSGAKPFDVFYMYAAVKIAMHILYLHVLYVRVRAH